MRFSAVVVALIILLGGVLGTVSSAVGQEADLPPVLRYQNKVVFNAADTRAPVYYLVQGGVRRVVDLEAVGSRTEVVGISPEELAEIPEASALIPTLPDLPPQSSPNTPTPTPPVVATSATAAVAAVSTPVAWSSPAPVLDTGTPEAQLRPAIQQLGAGRLAGEDVAFAVATSGDLFRYRNNSGTWQSLTSRMGLPRGAVPGALLVTRDDPSLVIYTVTGRTNGSLTHLVFRSTDGGESWSVSSVAGASARVLYQVPGRPATIFMGTNDGLQVSTDTGRTWSVVRRGMPTVGLVIWAIAADPNDPNTMYAGGQNIQGTGQVAGSLWATRDGGESWYGIVINDTASNLPPILSMQFDPSLKGRAVIGFDGGLGLAEVIPATPAPTPVDATPGPTPTPITIFRPLAATQMKRVAALGFRPGTGQLGGVPAGLVNAAGTPIATVVTRSDGGFAIPDLTPGTYGLVISGRPRPPELYAGAIPAEQGGTGTGGVFLSYDGGSTWTEVTSTIDSRYIGQVAFSNDGRIIYIGAGTEISATPQPGGVFRGVTEGTPIPGTPTLR